MQKRCRRPDSIEFASKSYLLKRHLEPIARSRSLLHFCTFSIMTRIPYFLCALSKHCWRSINCCNGVSLLEKLVRIPTRSAASVKDSDNPIASALTWSTSPFDLLHKLL